MAAVSPDVIRRLRIVHETPGADEAARKIRSVADAQREVAKASVEHEKATTGAERAVAALVERVERETRALRENQRVQAAVSNVGRSAATTLRSGSSVVGEIAASNIADTARLTAAGLRGLTPAIAETARVSGQSARILAEAMAPALVVVGKEATKTAVVFGRELLPLLGPLAPVAAGAAAYLAAAAAVGYLAKNATDAVKAYQDFEDSQLTLQNVLRATGGAAGRSAAQIEMLVKEIGNVDEARSAATALARNGGVSGEMFDRTLRLARDLSATGFGGLEASAKAVAAALKDPREGFEALEKAGLSFSFRQRETIASLAETGRTAEAQQAALNAIASKVGGAGAARDNTLTGAYTALSDAIQRSNEGLGEQISKLLRLPDVLKGAANAINAYNDYMRSGNSDDPYNVYGPGRVPRAFLGGEKAQERQRRRLQAQWDMMQNIEGEDAALGAAISSSIKKAEAVEKVINALEKERRQMQQTEAARETERRLIEAGVAASSEHGKLIAAEVAQNYRLKESIEARNKAQEEAAARQKRDEEFMRRTAEQRQTAIEKLLQERGALFMSAEAARAAALAQAELAKYRERGTAVSDGLRADIESWSRQVAEIERVNRSINDVKAATTDFATGFARDLRRGASATEAFATALDRLTDRLLDGVLKSAIDGLFGSLGQSGSQGWLTSLIRMSGIANANGNVFASGRLIPFAAGGVVDRPTIFPMANGMGLMGEAGAEAIMPLRRAPDGRLGVEARGGAGVAPVVNVSVQNNASGADVSVGQARRNTDGSISVDMIIDQASARMAQQVNAGRGPLAKIVQRGPVRRG